MDVAQLNVDQQRAIQNASMVANMDMAQFNADQQVILSNGKFMQTMTMQDLSNRPTGCYSSTYGTTRYYKR